jgi:hypothetical protein
VHPIAPVKGQGTNPAMVGLTHTLASLLRRPRFLPWRGNPAFLAEVPCGVEPGCTGRHATPTHTDLAARVSVVATLLVDRARRRGAVGRVVAAWADHPATLTAEQKGRIARLCADLRAVPGEETPRLPSTAVIDWRGAKVIAFFVDEERAVECVLDAVAGDDFEAAGGVGMEHAHSDLRVVNDDPHIRYAVNGVESSYTSDKYMVLVGRVGPEVDRVTIDVPGRDEAEASMNRGWISIWWPGTIDDGARLMAYDTQGRRLAQVPVTYE